MKNLTVDQLNESHRERLQELIDAGFKISINQHSALHYFLRERGYNGEENTFGVIAALPYLLNQTLHVNYITTLYPGFEREIIIGIKRNFTTSPKSVIKMIEHMHCVTGVHVV